MSGIAGVYNLNGAPVDGSLLSRMSAALAHRGPDAPSQWTHNAVGLAYRALHTTPESLHETQPLADETGTICLVMDGRVDDREWLRAQLLDQGAILRDISDAELVLNSYLIWGEECPDRIIGDFAFAIWDGRKQQLFCARDMVGLKPFYYWAGPRAFVFASEIPPLLLHPQLTTQPNELHIREALNLDIVSGDQTLHKEVQKLEPASAIVVTATGVRRLRYWTGEHIAELRYRSDSEYIDHFLDIYRLAVKSRLRSHRPVALRLSGGIDSSSIAAVAKPYVDQDPSNARFSAYSVVSPGDPDDESEFIKLTSKHLNLRSNQFPPFEPPPEFYKQQVAFYKDWSEYPNGVSVDGLRSAARDAGVRVLLTGFGGGDWFEGNAEYLVELCRKLRFIKLVGETLRLSGRGKPATSLVRHAIASSFPALKTTYRSFFPVNGENSPPWLLLQDAPLAQQIPWHLWSRAQQYTCSRALGGISILLGELEERADARFGMEGRHPLCDRRVVEFALSLPEHQRRLVPGQSKHVLRASMSGLVPDEIRLRGTSAYGSSSIARVLFTETAAKCFDDLKSAEMGWVDALVARQTFAQKRKAFMDGDSNYQSGLLALWMLYVLDLWLREE